MGRSKASVERCRRRNDDSLNSHCKCRRSGRDGGVRKSWKSIVAFAGMRVYEVRGCGQIVGPNRSGLESANAELHRRAEEEGRRDGRGVRRFGHPRDPQAGIPEPPDDVPMAEPARRIAREGGVSMVLSSRESATSRHADAGPADGAASRSAPRRRQPSRYGALSRMTA